MRQSKNKYSIILLALLGTFAIVLCYQTFRNIVGTGSEKTNAVQSAGDEWLKNPELRYAQKSSGVKSGPSKNNPVFPKREEIPATNEEAIDDAGVPLGVIVTWSGEKLRLTDDNCSQAEEIAEHDLEDLKTAWTYSNENMDYLDNQIRRIKGELARRYPITANETEPEAQDRLRAEIDRMEKQLGSLEEERSEEENTVNDLDDQIENQENLIDNILSICR